MPTVNLILSDVPEDEIIPNFIAKKYDLCPLKSSDQMRQEKESNTQLWLSVAENIRRGELVSEADLEAVLRNAFRKVKGKNILLFRANILTIDLLKFTIEEFGYKYGAAWRIKKRPPFYVPGTPHKIQEDSKHGKNSVEFAKRLDKTFEKLADVFKWQIVDFDDFIKKNI